MGMLLRQYHATEPETPAKGKAKRSRGKAAKAVEPTETVEGTEPEAPATADGQA